MFRGGQVNPYDDIIAKATDENQTSENWEILLNLCDKVSEEGEQGARNVTAALLKRLTHRNANVQLYSLSVAEALSKNCDITVHREIASKAFTQGLEKLATDRNGHDKVKKRTLALIKMWAGDLAYDPQLGLMEETYSNLKSKGMQFEDLDDTPAPTYDDEARRREEEELQRVLEMSLHDKGGRDRWAEYTSGGASGSGSGYGGGTAPVGSSSGPAYTPAAYPAIAASSSRRDTIPAPAPAPAPVAAPAPAPVPAPAPAPVQAPAPAPAPAPSYSAPAPAPAAAPSYSAVPTTQSPTAEAVPLDPGTMQIVKRVKALHDFNATESGELTFKKGDIIKVVDRCYKDWWRGQLKGRVGLLPVNYVEPLPEPTAAELAKEAEAEALVWSQGGAIDTLLQKLREFDPATENLNDNEEIQELYRSAMSLRPKILKLIDKYSQKKAELVVMNERYVKARNTFERMMEESVAKHNPSAAVYEYGPQAAPEGYGRPPADNRGVSTYGWNQSIYGQVPDPAAYAAYQAQAQAQQPQPPQQAPPVQNVPQEYPPQPYGQPQPQQTPYPEQQYAQQQQQQQQWYQGQQGQQPYGPQQVPNGAQQAPLSPGQQQPQPQPQPQQQGYQQGQPGYPYGPGGEPHAQPPQPQAQPQPQPQPQVQQGYQYGGEAQQPQQQPQPQPQAGQQAYQYGGEAQQPQPQPQPQAGQQGYQYTPEQQLQQQPQQQPAPEGQPGYHPTYQQGYQPQQQPQQQLQQQPQPQQQAYQPQPTEPTPAEQIQSPQPQHVQPDQTQVQAQVPAHDAQAHAHAQPQQQPQQQQQQQPQAGPPYLWNGTTVYPNPGASQWAEYYIGGGEDPAGLVYFTGPDGNVLTSIPPRGGVEGLQQQMAGVGLT